MSVEELSLTAIQTFHTSKQVCENSRFDLLNIICDKTTVYEEKIAALRRCILEFRNTRIDNDPEKLPIATKLAINQAASFLSFASKDDHASTAMLLAANTTNLIEAHNQMLERIKNILCAPETTPEEKIFHVENVLM